MWMSVVVAVLVSTVGEPGLVARENAEPGSAEWRLTRAAVSRQLEGYAGATSVQHGASIDIHARTDGNHTVRWELYRMGYYDGLGSRKMATGGPVNVGPQADPVPDPATGLVECRWPTSFTLQTQATWPSGVYLLKLIREDGLQSYVLFVLRADERKGVALVQIPFTTFQAYNTWGGESLYEDALGLTGGHAKIVSFDRPFADGGGAGEYFYYVHSFVQWAESRGYELSYVTNVDLDRDPSLARGQKLFIAVGHDEYWSRPARAAVEAALASGVNLAALAGDTSFWLIRLEPSATGVPYRRQVCYKEWSMKEDPRAGSNVTTVRWRDAPINEPENGLFGVMSDSWGVVEQPFVVTHAEAWPFEGTGLANGDTLPFVVGYEMDRAFTNGRTPAGFTPLGHSPVISNLGVGNWHDAGLYTAPSGAFVFAVGGIAWSRALSAPGYADARVQRITSNLFQRAGLAPAGPGDTFGSEKSRPVDRTGQAAGVALFAGAPFQEGRVDGPASLARFRRPVGLAVDASGNVFVADTGNHVVRMIANDAARTVSTLAGTGVAGVGEGPGASAALRSPQAVAVGPDSSLYVADTGNHRIVRIARDGRWTVSTFAGSREGRSGNAEGVGTAARFSTPSALAFSGNDLYVVDTFNHRLGRVTPDGRLTTVVGKRGVGSTDGAGAQARFKRPTGLAVGGGALWVVDTGNRAVRRVALDGAFTTSTPVGNGAGGFADGVGSAARFMPLLGAAWDNGQLLLTDTGNERIRAVADGRARTFAGTGAHGANDGAADKATFSLPTGIARLPDGTVLVVEQGASTVRRLTREGGGGPSTGPIPIISGGPFSGAQAPFDVFLDGTLTRTAEPGGWIQRFQWNFGDGTQAEVGYSTHSFQSPGRYTVTLTATDGKGVSASATQVVTVGVPAAAGGTGR